MSFFDLDNDGKVEGWELYVMNEYLQSLDGSKKKKSATDSGWADTRNSGLKRYKIEYEMSPEEAEKNEFIAAVILTISILVVAIALIV